MEGYVPEKNVDLHIHISGYEECKPGHFYGPAIREYYLFHYIFSGRGMYKVGRSTFYLQEGQGFLIYPGDLTYYQADDTFPWSYGWIGVTGLQVENYLNECGFTRENPIWQGERDEFLESCLMKMTSEVHSEPVRQPRNTGYAFLFLSRLIEKANLNQASLHQKNRQEAYLRTAIEYMEQHYHKKLTVGEISKHIGLDRSYLGSVFKKRLNTTMQEFLIDFRVKKACVLLQHEDIRIADVARSVGYLDQLQFSKIFKSRMGISPVTYRSLMNK